MKFNDLLATSYRINVTQTLPRSFVMAEGGKVEFALERSFELLQKLAEVEENDEKLEIIQEFLKIGHKLKLPIVPEFKKGEINL